VLFNSVLNSGILIGEDLSYEHTSKSTEDNEFDSVISALEDILFSEIFQNFQKKFCDDHSRARKFIPLTAGSLNSEKDVCPELRRSLSLLPGDMIFVEISLKLTFGRLRLGLFRM
jgi:hypothetical protein